MHICKCSASLSTLGLILYLGPVSLVVLFSRYLIGRPPITSTPLAAPHLPHPPHHTTPHHSHQTRPPNHHHHHHHAPHQTPPPHHHAHHRPRRPRRLRHLSSRMRRRRRSLLFSRRSSHGRDGRSRSPPCGPGLQCGFRVLPSGLLGGFGCAYALSVVWYQSMARYGVSRS